MTKKTDKENFYIAIPNKYDEDYVIFEHNRFEKCLLKCGEIINESFEERYRGTNTLGGMFCVYKFYCDTNLISNNRTQHFDTLLFGHGKIHNVWKKTIWAKCECYPESNGRMDIGQEFMDCAKLLNKWIKKTPSSKNHIDAINDMEDITGKRLLIKGLIKLLFECNFTSIIEQFTSNKIEKKSLKLFTHQSLVFVALCKLLNEGLHNIVSQIPCRFGKTLTFLYLFIKSPWRVMFVSSYVKTVGNSYTQEVNTYKEFSNIQLVDIDNVDNFEYRPGAKVLVEFPTNGSIHTIIRRINNARIILQQINATPEEMFFLNEESDYGQHTIKSDEKFMNFMKEFNADGKMTIISTTGTEAFKAEKLNAFGEFDGRVSVNDNDWEQIIM